ncbi:MAG: hypothetical protein EOP45_19000 [Sphingobacteriaceae bacterium]|nr:MAG: hypothetical protein EOP45_19000 [Sphingobacteriaceae bacterium]
MSIAKLMFREERCMAKVGQNFCEIWFPDPLRNIQLIHAHHNHETLSRAEQHHHYASTILIFDSFDMTYCCAAIFHDENEKLRWGCTEAYLYAQNTMTTFKQSAVIVSIQRVEKAQNLGYEWISQERGDDRLAYKIEHDYFDNLYNNSQIDSDLHFVYLKDSVCPLLGTIHQYSNMNVVSYNGAKLQRYFWRLRLRTWMSVAGVDGGINLEDDPWVFIKERNGSIKKVSLADKDAYQMIVGAKVYGVCYIGSSVKWGAKSNCHKGPLVFVFE